MKKPHPLSEPRRGLIISSAILLGLALPAFAQEAAPGLLRANARGAAAIEALGLNLQAVAQAYGLSSQRLTTLLQTQRGLGIDRSGQLNFVCEAPVVRAAAAPSSTTSAESSSSATDAFRLHSFEGAQRVIYLDFDGHTTSGTSWNSNYNGGNPIHSAPFDLDGSPSSFNAQERNLIYKIWQRVAEDYAGFLVNVTTEDPGLDALRKSNSSDTAYGIRVVISPTSWMDAGGVAYIGSFTWNSDTPCFVFSAQLANGEKYIAECASHEAGHTLRLYHDGTGGSAANPYYMGHGNWAPIMGAGYYAAVTHFSRGEYANANNTEDDLSIIASYVPYVTDDHGNTLGTASTLSGTTIADGGTIEKNTDVDVFRFVTNAGAISFSVQGHSPDPNLDAQVELLDASGQVLQTSNPAGLSAALSATVSAGTYYLQIRGVGAGAPATSGYSNYGSLGNYVITGTLPTSTPALPQAPTAIASASGTTGTAPFIVTFSGAGSSDADGTIVGYRWDFGTGASATTVNPSYTYNSAGNYNATLTVTDNTGLTGTATVAISVAASSGSGNVAPAFTTQPVSQTVVTGSTVVFSVAVTGSPAPTIVWYRNGVTFGGWSGSTLTLPGVSSNDTGTYTAVATNAAGSVTSTAATLSIGTTTTPPPPPPPTGDVAPTITSQPLSVTVVAGGTTTFSVGVAGSPTPTVVWYRNGATFAGWTGSTLTLASVSANDAGTYTALVTNLLGSVASAPATLSIGTTTTPPPPPPPPSTGDGAPTITSQPVSRTATAGGTATFTVGFTGSPTPTVQWYRNGVTFTGWTASTLTLYGASTNDVGNYTAVVSNPNGSVTSAPASLSISGAAATVATKH